MTGGGAPPPALPRWLRTGAGFITVQVLARPGASRRGVVRVDERGIVVGLRSAAEKGKANDELAGLMAELVSVPRAAVTIIRGAGARAKVVRIDAAPPMEAALRVTALAIGHPK